jgi:hypothetical protein
MSPCFQALPANYTKAYVFLDSVAKHLCHHVSRLPVINKKVLLFLDSVEKTKRISPCFKSLPGKNNKVMFQEHALVT